MVTIDISKIQKNSVEGAIIRIRIFIIPIKDNK